eukprot:TRINITY_DN69823_c0_g1_i1.p1 TRINITY_DN69823_c0_g1~~TRINITY_DN69823_c0_g1_i1.p1  ORF type:complete len:500 (+),score=67.13 TRINITY_DN69823_c0_g1_i1:49-1500(+)
MANVYAAPPPPLPVHAVPLTLVSHGGTTPAMASLSPRSSGTSYSHSPTFYQPGSPTSLRQTSAAPSAFGPSPGPYQTDPSFLPRSLSPQFAGAAVPLPMVDAGKGSGPVLPAMAAPVPSDDELAAQPLAVPRSPPTANTTRFSAPPGHSPRRVSPIRGTFREPTQKLLVGAAAPASPTYSVSRSPQQGSPRLSPRSRSPPLLSASPSRSPLAAAGEYNSVLFEKDRTEALLRDARSTYASREAEYQKLRSELQELQLYEEMNTSNIGSHRQAIEERLRRLQSQRNLLDQAITQLHSERSSQRRSEEVTMRRLNTTIERIEDRGDVERIQQLEALRQRIDELADRQSQLASERFELDRRRRETTEARHVHEMTLAKQETELAQREAAIQREWEAASSPSRILSVRGDYLPGPSPRGSSPRGPLSGVSGAASSPLAGRGYTVADSAAQRVHLEWVRATGDSTGSSAEYLMSERQRQTQERHLSSP